MTLTWLLCPPTPPPRPLPLHPPTASSPLFANSANPNHHHHHHHLLLNNSSSSSHAGDMENNLLISSPHQNHSQHRLGMNETETRGQPSNQSSSFLGNCFSGPNGNMGGKLHSPNSFFKNSSLMVSHQKSSKSGQASSSNAHHSHNHGNSFSSANSSASAAAIASSIVAAANLNANNNSAMMSHNKNSIKLCRRRKARTVFSDQQLSGLEKRFESQKYLSTPERVELANSLGLSETQVIISCNPYLVTT